MTFLAIDQRCDTAFRLSLGRLANPAIWLRQRKISPRGSECK
jgi:hypothetical protein